MSLIPALTGLVTGYLLGSLPTGFLVGRWLAGVDIREHGSGSIGATNVMRVVGRGPALFVFVVDVLKGSVAVLLASRLLEPVLGPGVSLDAWTVGAGLAALAGHIWPVWLRFRGGKAVATGLGMLLGLSWPVALACLGVFLACLAASRVVSLSSVVAALSLPLLMLGWFFTGEGMRLPYLLLALLSAAMVLWRHRSNLARLMAGTEPRIGENAGTPSGSP